MRIMLNAGWLSAVVHAGVGVNIQKYVEYNGSEQGILLPAYHIGQLVPCRMPHVGILIKSCGHHPGI